MPTGYTDKIGSGISFEKFVLGCARSFGACVTIRDESKEFEIQKFKPTKYYQTEAKKALQKLNEAFAMNYRQATEAGKLQYNSDIEYNLNHARKRCDLKYKYYKMLQKVQNWEPPTDEHINLKDFMIYQIQDSIEFDCNIYIDYPVLKNGFKYHEDLIDSIKIGY